ncbi:MAG TPA: hypothetical protein VGM56_04365 [Byssovorax sp.]|jgi:hypothetical protein
MELHTKVAALALFAVCGCSSSEAAPRRGAETAPAPVAPRASSSRIETANYVLEATVPAGAKAGQEAAIEVRLTTKGDYHLNKQYPYKFKVASPPPEGVTFPKQVLERGDGAFEEKSCAFKVPFVAAKAGKTVVGGTLSMSVCSEANCVMDKQAVEVAVDVQ